MSVSFDFAVEVIETVVTPEFAGYDETDDTLMFTVTAVEGKNYRDMNYVDVAVIEVGEDSGNVYGAHRVYGRSVAGALQSALPFIVDRYFPQDGANWELRTVLNSEGGNWELHLAK